MLQGVKFHPVLLEDETVWHAVDAPVVLVLQRRAAASWHAVQSLMGGSSAVTQRGGFCSRVSPGCTASRMLISHEWRGARRS
jgi:hypothetical protein